MESPVTIECNNIRLEGLMHENASTKAVIVCHPHPLYGGNMENPVVMTIGAAFFKKGFTTLRFNFRGTGNSTGMFDDGNGEQDDLRSAMAFLSQAGYKQICLAGYSFGARMTASVVSKGCDIIDHIMVSPPVGFMSFDDIQTLPLTGLVVSGANDDIAPSSLVQAHLDQWQIAPRYEIIDNCDHFYSGCLETLATLLTDYLPDP